MNYHDQMGSFPPGGFRPAKQNNFGWRSMILPQIEENPLNNSINFALALPNQANFTIWMTTITTMLCPSDGNNGNGRMPFLGPYGQYTYGLLGPIDPSTGVTVTTVTVSNYDGSWGDNYAGVTTNLPWETPRTSTTLPKIGFDGYWGTTANTGSLRGIFDYSGVQVRRLQDVTDGTSNSIMAGEALPIQDADNDFWEYNGCTAGTTIPINWNSNSVDPTTTPCNQNWGDGIIGCRFTTNAKGFKSMHPGGANFLLVDGSVHFLKQSISPVTYAGLGSVNGGEIISSDAY